MCSRAASRGVSPSRTATYAAVPTACPTMPQVAITRVEANAQWVALMLRPANMRLSMFTEYSERSGMQYGSVRRRLRRWPPSFPDR